MTFERPELLALAPLTVLLVSLLVTAQWRRGVRLVEAYGGPDAATRLAGRDVRRFPGARLACLILATLCLTVSAAGPDGEDSIPPSAAPVDVVVALDVSLSMTAEDVGTSRAQRARTVVDRLTEAFGEERIALAVFADWPYTLVPPTDDPAVLRFFTASLAPELVAERDQGTSLAAVVAHARRTLDARRRPEAEAIIVVVTDGEVDGDARTVLDSVAVAVGDSVRLWTAGVGSREGATLADPARDGRLLSNPDGSPVVTRINDDLLREMATAGGGRYHDVSDERGVDALLDDLSGVGSSERASGRDTNRAFWLVIMALPFLLWEGATDSGRRLPWRPDSRGTG